MRCISTGIAVAALLSGCANHVEFVDLVEIDRSSKLIEARYEIEGGDSTLVEPKVELSFSRIERYQDTTRSETVRYELVTPYQGAREFYEVPLGLISVPLSFTANVIWVGSLFYIPRHFIDAYTSWTFAALNPGLNAESGERVTRTRADVVSDDTAQNERTEVVPLSRQVIDARFDSGGSTTKRTDSAGRLDIHLLDLVQGTLTERPRKLIVEFTPEGSDGTIAREFFVDRGLGRRLAQAVGPMYAVLDGGMDERALARSVVDLERLGFREFSLELEDSVLRDLAGEPERVRAFRDELESLYRPTEAPGGSADTGAGSSSE